VLQVLKFLGLLVLGLLIFTFNVVFVVFSPGLFLLPIIPLVRLAYPGTAPGRYRPPWRFCWGLRWWWLPLRFPPLKDLGRRPGFTLAGPRRPGS
jgi:hypothetical protein